MTRDERLAAAEDLTKENNLYQIWKQIRRGLPESKFNIFTLLLWSILVAVHVYFLRLSLSTTLDGVRALSEIGISFGSSILGFLLAGFAIFATMSKPKMLVQMAKIKHPKSNLSYLKYSYFALIEVFIVYTVFIVICFSFRVFVVPRGGFGFLIEKASSHWAPFLKTGIARFSYWILATTFLWIILKLKSFIYNIYKIVMTGVRWDVEDEIKEDFKEPLPK